LLCRGLGGFAAVNSLGAPDDPVRRALLRALAVGILSSAGDAVARSKRNAPLQKFALGQSIRRISGRVLVNGRRATLATPIGTGDSIETAANAEIVFVLGAQTLILRGGRRIVIGEPKSQIKNALRLTTGKVASLPGRVAPGLMVAESSTIGIRN
jgi:hypothetical protein